MGGRAPLRWLWLALASCTAAGPSGELTLSPDPKAVADNGQVSVLTVYATDGAGNPGTGTVALTVDLGRLSARQVTLEDGGATSVEYSCDKVTTPLCNAGATNQFGLVTGRWTPPKGKVVVNTLSMTVRAPYPDGG